MIEYSVTVKDENTKIVESDTTSDPLVLDPNNEYIHHLVKSALDKFKADPNLESPEIVFRAKMVIQL